MRNEQVINLCKGKEQELLDKYFGNLVHETAIRDQKLLSSTRKICR